MSGSGSSLYEWKATCRFRVAIWTGRSRCLLEKFPPNQLREHLRLRGTCLTASFLPKRLARETNLSLHVGAASSVMGEADGAAVDLVVAGNRLNFIVEFASFCGQGKFRDYSRRRGCLQKAFEARPLIMVSF